MGAMRKSVHTAEYGALTAELRRLRSKAGLTQRELAARLAVPPSWIAKVESAERRIDVVEFCWIAIACDGDASDSFARVQRAVQWPKPARARS